MKADYKNSSVDDLMERVVYFSNSISATKMVSHAFLDGKLYLGTGVSDISSDDARKSATDIALTKLSGYAEFLSYIVTESVLSKNVNIDRNETSDTMSESDKGFVRPIRCSYIHLYKDGEILIGHGEVSKGCGEMSTMPESLAEEFAHDPKCDDEIYCSHCQLYRHVNEFTWAGTDEVVGS